MRLGQVQLLLHAVAEAAAEQSARADGDLTHRSLEAAVAHIRERVEPDIDALLYVFERHISAEPTEHSHHEQRAEKPDADACGNQNDKADGAADDDGRGVRLLIEQADIDEQQQAVRIGEFSQVLHILVLGRGPRGERDDDGILRELGRLKAEQPACRALGRGADARDKDQDQQRNADDDGRIYHHDVAVVVDAAQHVHGDEADRRPAQLPHDEVGRAALRIEGARIARRKQGDKADDQQQQRCAHGRHVDGVRLSRAAARLFGCPFGRRRAVALPGHRLARGTRRRIGLPGRRRPDSPAAARAARLSC